MNADRKQTLGEFLKSERERRGLTIEQTSSATKIGLKILKQLEADQYVDLPALPFVRGFVRNYGKFLGLDGEKLLKEYSAFLESHANERPKRDAGHSGYAFERPEGEQSRKILWGVMAGMLVFGGAVVFLFKPSLKRKHHGHVDKMKPGGVESEGEEMPNPNPTGSPLPSGTPAPSGVPSALSTLVPSAVPAVAVSPAPPPAPSPTPTATPTHSPEPFIPPKTPLVLAPSPIPTHSPVAIAPAAPSPTPSPSLVPSATPSAAPSAAPSASAPVDAADDLKADPLQSGKTLAPKDVHYKVILRTKEDVWVRYRCDEKQPMKFALKKDKILVLRAKTVVYVQVSNPDSITIQAQGRSEFLFSDFDGAFNYQGNSTAVFPGQARGKMEESFKVGPPLPQTPPPAVSSE